jgi:hypothetical protein
MVKAIWPTEDGHYEDCGACDICAHPEWGADCFKLFVPKEKNSPAVGEGAHSGNNHGQWLANC